MSSLPLSGKSALVTGGARRIGRAIAMALSAEGADVSITYKTSITEAASTVREIEAAGGRAFAVSCDVRSETEVRGAIAAVTSKFGRLDVLVNNAAIFETAPMDQITLERWDAVFETNVRGPFLFAREAIDHLRRVEGRIVNIGSLGGERAWAGHAHYCSSKAALHMLTQAMAKGFAPDVSVNCVAPGWIAMEDSNVEASRKFAARTPMERNGSAEDIAQAVLFFATATEFITGQILTVDGGLGLG